MFSIYDRSRAALVRRDRAALASSGGARRSTCSTTGTSPPATCAPRAGCTSRIDVDFNGWFMCLIPRQVLEEIGLSLPLFIKWDDSEFGLRAKEAGYPTVTFPGAAVWHIPWTDKNDALDWQAYFHHRNRFIAALLHSPYPQGGPDGARVPRPPDQAPGLDAVLHRRAAPQGDRGRARRAGALHRELPTKLAEVNAFRKQFTDAAAGGRPRGVPRRYAVPSRRGAARTRARSRAGSRC